MQRIAVMTSGGDAPGMNAAVRAVVRAAIHNDMSVIGFKRGYNGMLMRSRDTHDDFEIMTRNSVSDKIHRGGTFLMTARCTEFIDIECQKQVIKNMRLLGIEGLIGIGGDGTFRGLNALNELGFPTVGIPGTIDNDMEYTDLTLGFDSALNTACECIDRVRETSDSHERASLITVMGRNCGDIALHTALACGAEYVMIPEAPWNIESIANRIKWGRLNGKRSTIIVMAEGAFASLTSDVEKICRENESLHGIINDTMTSSKLAAILEALSGQETRSTILGYIQRGGSPSSQDRILGSRFGEYAVNLLRDDISGRAVGIRDNKLIDMPFSEIVGQPQPFRAELMHLVSILGR